MADDEITVPTPDNGALLTQIAVTRRELRAVAEIVAVNVKPYPEAARRLGLMRDECQRLIDALGPADG